MNMYSYIAICIYCCYVYMNMCAFVHVTTGMYIGMLNKNTLGVKKVRGQSEATMVI